MPRPVWPAAETGFRTRKGPGERSRRSVAYDPWRGDETGCYGLRQLPCGRENRGDACVQADLVEMCVSRYVSFCARAHGYSVYSGRLGPQSPVLPPVAGAKLAPLNRVEIECGCIGLQKAKVNVKFRRATRRFSVTSSAFRQSGPCCPRSCRQPLPHRQYRRKARVPGRQ